MHQHQWRRTRRRKKRPRRIANEWDLWRVESGCRISSHALSSSSWDGHLQLSHFADRSITILSMHGRRTNPFVVVVTPGGPRFLPGWSFQVMHGLPGWQCLGSSSGQLVIHYVVLERKRKVARPGRLVLLQQL